MSMATTSPLDTSLHLQSPYSNNEAVGRNGARTELNNNLPLDQVTQNPVEEHHRGESSHFVRPAHQSTQPESIYSIFSHRQKKIIISFASIAAFLSPLSSQIYLPAVEQIAQDFHTTNNRINLTITTFLIFQGLAPTFVAAFSDELGRRPAYLVCFPVYIAANIGLALQRSYGALMVLRCLQSTGSSGTVTLSNAVVADMVTSAERGVYVGFAQIGTILGPAIGPILGGIISQFAGWDWIFWFLTILASVLFLPLVLFLPETCRRIVGNGSRTAPILNQPLAGLRLRRKSPRAERTFNATNDATPHPRTKRFFNPFAVLIVMVNAETSLILFCNGFAIACFIAVTTSIPSQFKQMYNYNELEISLIYLPISLGSLISAFSTGKLIDWNYRRHALRLGFPVVQNTQHDLINFPLEKARLEIALPQMYLAAVTLIVYGWVLHLETGVAVPLVLLAFFGYAIVAAYQVTAILLVDIHPGKPATATAANNLIRCLLSAGASACINPMLETMGRGWTYTFWSLVWLIISPCFWFLMACGIEWRKRRRERESKGTPNRSEIGRDNLTEDEKA